MLPRLPCTTGSALDHIPLDSFSSRGDAPCWYMERPQARRPYPPPSCAGCFRLLGTALARGLFTSGSSLTCSSTRESCISLLHIPAAYPCCMSSCVSLTPQAPSSHWRRLHPQRPQCYPAPAATPAPSTVAADGGTGRNGRNGSPAVARLLLAAAAAAVLVGPHLPRCHPLPCPQLPGWAPCRLQGRAPAPTPTLAGARHCTNRGTA